MGKGELLWYPRGTEGNKQGVDTPASLTLPLIGQEAGEPRWGLSRVQPPWHRVADMGMGSQTVTPTVTPPPTRRPPQCFLSVKYVSAARSAL